MKRLLSTLIIYEMLMLAAAQAASAQSGADTPNHNPRGYLVERYGVTQEQEDMINRLSRRRSDMIDSLSALGLPPHAYRSQRDSVTDIYYQQVRSVLTPEQQLRFNPEALKAARTGEVKALNLPVETEIAMGALKAGREQSMQAADALPHKEAKVRRAAVEADYRRELRLLLGEEKYGEWLAYKNGATERKFKTEFGFTDEQFERYKTIERREAVQVAAIKSVAMSPEERDRRITEARQAKVDSMRVILTGSQFDKWLEYCLRKEERRAHGQK